MNIKRKLILLVALLVVGAFLIPGCATGPKYSPVTSTPNDKALIFVFEKSRTLGLGAANSYKIFVNGKHITNMWTGGYFPYLAEPGPSAMAMDLRVTPLTGLLAALEEEIQGPRFDAEAGRTYYVEVRLGFESGLGKYTLELVDETTGAQEVRKGRMTEKIE